VTRDSRSLRLPLTLAVLYLLVWIWSAIEPLHPADWRLENLLVAVLVPPLVLTWRLHRFSSLSYILIFCFLVLHSVGAHYTYSEVPLGFWVRDWLGLSRNHYDRAVHFCFGFLLAIPMRELLMRLAGVRRFWSYYLAFDATCALSGLYEIVEWIAASVTNPELGTAYLGTQGDEWDAQKDMAMALSGALLSLGALALWRRLCPDRASTAANC
jgi:putative membrane protein